MSKEKSSLGVKVFSIAGRMEDQRERCMGMSEEERRWRAQYLKDQVLDPTEPRNSPELYKDTTNFIRRLWRTPMYKFQEALSGIFGPVPGYMIRHFIGKTSMFFAAGYIVTYYFKYHSNDFTREKSLHVHHVTPRLLPGDPGYPNLPNDNYKEPMEWVDHGFLNSPLAVKITKPPQVEKTPPRVKSGGGVCEPPEE